MTAGPPRDYGPFQLADYLRACWPEVHGSVGRARHFGLIPEPDRARGRWSAALAEEIRARWPETVAASRCIGATGLRERGWTETMIRDLLGEPALRVDNPHYKSADPMRLWRLQDVEAAEAAPGFTQRRERAERQCAAAARAGETRKLWKALGGLSGRLTFPPGIAAGNPRRLILAVVSVIQPGYKPETPEPDQAEYIERDLYKLLSQPAFSKILQRPGPQHVEPLLALIAEHGRRLVAAERHRDRRLMSPFAG